MSNQRAVQTIISLVIALCLSQGLHAESTCLYVSSYHAGYHWNDGIENGLQQKLNSACKLEKFYMDTKRQKSPEHAKRMATEAKKLIDDIKPDVVIACDDNASRYLVVPHLKGTETPVVFCGVNWTVDRYGYPSSNVTGMIEVAPIRPLIHGAKRLVPDSVTVTFLSADVVTQQKDAERLKKVADADNLSLSVTLASSFEAWKKSFIQVQQNSDFIILGNPAGISDWDAATAHHFIRDNTRKLTVSYGLAMSKHAIFSMVNDPVEQGEWSAQVARLILQGEKAGDIPIVSNRRWRMFVNPTLAVKAGITLPESDIQNATRVD
jgi:ABC-type uncharacterized transport system substrate-binding protein